MNRFAAPRILPPCAPVQPEFERHFSGWHLGMGLAQSLAGFLPGLFKLGAEKPGCKSAALGMALWAFQAHPLAPGLAPWEVRALKEGLRVGEQTARTMLLAASAPPLGQEDAEAMDAWFDLARQDDRSLILRFLAAVLKHPEKGLSWLGHVWQDCIHLGIPEISAAALDMTAWPHGSEPIRQRMKADRAFHCLPPGEALDAVEALGPGAWGLWRAYAGGELLLRLGKKGEAKSALAGLWMAVPWHVNLTLKVHDLFNPPKPGDPADTAETAILVYSWNKADLLADTLESLLASDIGRARVFALNNGSTDHTADVLDKARQAFGPDRFHIETLPVNVGAPAARNWLLSLDEVKAAKWAAFLDDDINLPPDWLLTLLGAAGGRDDIGAVGCRITGAVPPYGLQSADYNLFPTPPAQPGPNELPNRVQVFDNCAGSLDTGLFTYSRPCLSVSGCCHLVSMASIAKTGGFDLRYTPSQFDDLDRDLRAGLAGMPALYAGHLAIRHVQHSSLARSRTAAQIGQVLGNKFKLDAKYSDEELARLASANRALLWDDLKRKSGFLVDRLGLSA
ncbi:MAG: glycosyltransferase family 2 protein [Desulfovibrionaceae bacterium]|nr:glycosyltransferase family 2 protein [Desulfovibrionaceae bacterium]